MLPFVLSGVDPATARSERGEENTERAALLPYLDSEPLSDTEVEKISDIGKVNCHGKTLTRRGFVVGAV